MHILWLDYVLVGIIAYSVWTGIRRGLVLIISDVAGLALGWYLATHYATRLGTYMFRFGMAREVYITNILSSASIYVASFLAVSYAGRWLSGRVNLAFPTRFVNLFLGGLLGVAKGCLIVAPLVFPTFYFQYPVMKQSQLLTYLNPKITPYTHKIDIEKLKDYLPDEVYINTLVKAGQDLD